MESLPIIKVDNYCDLGIILSSNLSWKPHLQHILSEAYKMLGLFRHIFSTTILINSIKAVIYFSNPIKVHLLFSLMETLFNQTHTTN